MGPVEISVFTFVILVVIKCCIDTYKYWEGEE